MIVSYNFGGGGSLFKDIFVNCGLNKQFGFGEIDLILIAEIVYTLIVLELFLHGILYF